MQVASTIQFRNAVRTIAQANGINIIDSYTNSNRKSGNRRTVGFAMPSASDRIAVAVERLLNAQSLTAKTRFTDSASNNHYTTGAYIRGTCVTA